jgi:hypothetical protein
MQHHVEAVDRSQRASGSPVALPVQKGAYNFIEFWIVLYDKYSDHEKFL